MTLTIRLIVVLLVFTASRVTSGHPMKIVGGSDASSGQFPAVVSLQKTDTLKHFCGGSLISATVVLSAAHCFFDYSQDAAKTVIYVGSIDLSSGGAYYNLSRVIIHSEYNDPFITNDISLAQTAKPVIFSKTVQPLQLPEPGLDIPGGTDVTAVGWGRNGYPDGELQDILQFVQLRVISLRDCKGAWDAVIKESEICVGGDVGKGVCGGDSGGPIILGNTVVGIVSWGRPCAVGYPDINTRVSEYIDWIHDNEAALEIPQSTH